MSNTNKTVLANESETAILQNVLICIALIKLSSLDRMMIFLKLKYKKGVMSYF